MTDHARPAAPGSRELPERLSLRHSKLEAKRRLAAGEFATLGEAQLGVAREHGMSSWAALKRHATASGAEAGPALAHVRWILRRYGDVRSPGWTAPDRSELGGHFTEGLMSRMPPKALAAVASTLASSLREELVLLDAGPLHLNARIADLTVRAVAEPEVPHRLATLQITPGGARVTDQRAARPPVVISGPVPGPVPGLLKESHRDLGVAGLTAAGDTGDGLWAYSRGWADLEQDLPLNPGHRFPAYAVTTLITSTAVLRLVAEGIAGLDDPVNKHLRALRLADDAVTLRDLLSHTSGIDSPSREPAGVVADVPGSLGPVAGCSGQRGEFAFSNAGYAVLSQLVADLTGIAFARAAIMLVLEPLGMADSSFPQLTPVSPDTVRAYRLSRAGRFEPASLPVSAWQGAGGLWTTGPDLVRFTTAWRSLLPENLAAEALRPQARQYDSDAEAGLGWLLRRPLDLAGQAGHGPGSSVSLLTRPGTGRTAVMLTNRSVPVEQANAWLLRELA